MLTSPTPLQRLWRARNSFLLLAPTLILLITFQIIPVINGFAFAFQDVEPGLRSEWVGLANFRRIGSDGILLRSTVNLAILVVAGMAKGVVFPLAVAVMIARLTSGRVRYLFQSMFVFPIVVPGMVTVLLWKGYIYDPNVGLINQTLAAVGLGAWQHAWLGEHSTALASLIFTGFPWMAGTSFLIIYAGLIAMPQSIFESAMIDGIGPFKRFWLIELPLVLGQLRLVMVLGFIGTVQDFGGTLLMTGGGPGAATHIPALHMYYMAFRFEEFGYAAAIGVVLFFIILALSMTNLWLVRSSVED